MAQIAPGTPLEEVIQSCVGALAEHLRANEIFPERIGRRIVDQSLIQAREPQSERVLRKCEESNSYFITRGLIAVQEALVQCEQFLVSGATLIVAVAEMIGWLIHNASV